MGAFVGLAGKALKAVLKIALFCGLAWFLIPFGVWLATELITGKYLEQVPVMNTVCNILWYMCYGFAPLTLIQNIIRVIKKDQSFSWIRLIMNRKEQKGFEAKLGGDAVALKTAKDTGQGTRKDKGKRQRTDRLSRRICPVFLLLPFQWRNTCLTHKNRSTGR